MAEQETIFDPLEQDKKIRHEHRFFFDISTGLVFILILLIIGKLIFKDDAGYGSNVYLNIIAVLTTILVLDRRAGHRAEQHAQKALKERLVMEAGSQSNETAKSAVYELDKRGWLKGEAGLLKGADLRRARLQEVDLQDANLQKANFAGANLQDTNLVNANLQESFFFRTNLQGVKLTGANLQRSNLIFIDLQGAFLQAVNLRRADLQFIKLQGAVLSLIDMPGARLSLANLQGARIDGDLREVDLSETNLQDTHLSVRLGGADLTAANLQGANLYNSEFDENTILLDKTRWTASTDMARFIDPQHPDFFRVLPSAEYLMYHEPTLYKEIIFLHFKDFMKG